MNANQTQTEIEQQIISLIAAAVTLPEGDIALTEPLTGYGVDSLLLVELLVEIEEKFDIAFDSSSLSGEHFATAAAIAGYVREKLEAA